MGRFALLFVLAAGFVVAAEEKKKAESADGTWIIISVDLGGKKATEEELKQISGKITLTGDKWVLKLGDMVSSGTSKIDKTKKPAEIDTTTTEGVDKGKTLKGIIEINGDTMRVCFDGSGTGRPKEFSSKGQAAYIVIEYKREKK